MKAIKEAELRREGDSLKIIAGGTEIGRILDKDRLVIELPGLRVAKKSGLRVVLEKIIDIKRKNFNELWRLGVELGERIAKTAIDLNEAEKAAFALLFVMEKYLRRELRDPLKFDTFVRGMWYGAASVLYLPEANE